MLFLFVAVLGLSALGWELKRRHQPPPMHAGNFMRLALLPGERYGIVWPAAHVSGDPMIATITSAGVFALNYVETHAAPIRLRPAGVVVTAGTQHMITPGASEPMVDVALSVPDQPRLSFRIALSGSKALISWAKPSP